MIINLTIILIIIIFLLLQLKKIKSPSLVLNEDDYLIQNYQNKNKFSNKVVIVIEYFENLQDLLNIIRSILNQNIKIDSIVVISNQDDLKNIKFISDTCVLNKVGGLSFLFKESCNETTIIYVFPEGFSQFLNPQFLNLYLNKDLKINGIIKVENKFFNACVEKIFK